MIRAARRRAFHAFTSRLGRFASHAPGFVYGASDLFAPLVFPSIPHEAVTRVFPELDASVVREISRRAPRTSMRNLLLGRSLIARGMDAVRDRALPQPRLAELQPPLILGTFHIGAITALGGALEQLPGNVLVLRATKPHVLHPNFTIEATRVDEQRRALLFHRSVEFLRDGKYVFMPLDPEEATRISAPFRGRTLQLARGPFALSRLARVPIVPLVARWRGVSIEYVLGEPLPLSNDEGEIAAAAASWLEGYLRDSPLEISRRILNLTT